MKYKYILSVFFLLSTYLFSFANSFSCESFQDTFPSSNPDYKGYRIAITDLAVEQNENWMNFRFTVINTGKKDISMSDNDSNPLLVIKFEELSLNPIIEEQKNLFTEALLKSEFNIKAGEILFDHELKIKNNNFSNNTPDEVEKKTLPAEIAAINLSDNSKTYVTEKAFSEPNNDDNSCSDLIIESISIVKKSKNSVTLKYKIKNQGKKPVSIIGKPKSEDNNLALTIHMSSSEKLTRGSIPIGGTYMKNGKQIPDGKLYPGKSLTDEIKIDIRNMTRFTPVIILEIDPYLSVQECDETNNLNSIKVKD